MRYILPLLFVGVLLGMVVYQIRENNFASWLYLSAIESNRGKKVCGIEIGAIRVMWMRRNRWATPSPCRPYILRKKRSLT